MGVIPGSPAPQVSALPTEQLQIIYLRILLQCKSEKWICVLQRNSGVSTPNILAWKSEEGPMPLCNIGAESEGNNRLGDLISRSSQVALLLII
jgi:hypothetical protein